MEGTSTRTFPRMLLDRPIELEIGEKKIQVENPSNNLSVGGLYVRRGSLPVGTPVHVRIPVNHHFFEADGQIRSCEPARPVWESDSVPCRWRIARLWMN